MRIALAISFIASFTSAHAATLAFEVASVKPAPPPTGPGLRVGMNSDAGRITYSNVTLRNVLTQAYKVKDSQIVGHDWLKSERYDITAKLPEGATKEQIPEMLQTLLAERFKLALHRETKVMPVYAIVAAKNGPKLHEAEAESTKKGLRMMMGPKGMQLTGSVTIERLADSLSNMMARPVIDMTETKAAYDIDLSWTPDESQMGGKLGMMHGGPRPEGGSGGGGEGKSEGPDGPSIFMALQEKLGLKLDARKMPVDLLTIDHAEKIPVEN
jgi:uncharacterized protein (TIGR03435 family)